MLTGQSSQKLLRFARRLPSWRCWTIPVSWGDPDGTSSHCEAQNQRWNSTMPLWTRRAIGWLLPPGYKIDWWYVFDFKTKKQNIFLGVSWVSFLLSSKKNRNKSGSPRLWSWSVAGTCCPHWPGNRRSMRNGPGGLVKMVASKKGPRWNLKHFLLETMVDLFFIYIFKWFQIIKKIIWCCSQKSTICLTTMVNNGWWFTVLFVVEVYNEMCVDKSWEIYRSWFRNQPTSSQQTAANWTNKVRRSFSMASRWMHRLGQISRCLCSHLMRTFFRLDGETVGWKVGWPKPKRIIDPTSLRGRCYNVWVVRSFSNHRHVGKLETRGERNSGIWYH